MSKFNETKKVNIRNLAGGKAYKESDEMALVSLLLTSFGDDKFYEREATIYNRLSELISKCDKLFVAKAIIYARSQFGMRSITHVASSILARYIGGADWGTRFYDKVVHRVDDMLEITAFHFSKGQKLSNAMRKGFAKALGRFDEYQLAKYRGLGKSIKLVDLVNLCHPIQTDKNGRGIEKLINGELKSFDTWESELSKAGNDKASKIAVWNSLLDANKLGYFALLRNIRNIVRLDDEKLKKKALNALLNERMIRNSLVLPFRYSTAYDEMINIDSDSLRAIGRACEIACKNVPEFDGKTLIALDESGSMLSGRISDIASLFASVLLKTQDADLITFANTSRYRHFNADDSVMTIKNGITFSSGRTNFVSVFDVANKKYDRIILLSDMQAWSVNDSWYMKSPKSAYEGYKKRYNATDCKLYSIDLAGYGTLQLPQKDVFCLAGFSERIFDLMKYLETDKRALITEISKIDL